jgi:hypothetical protein
MLAGRARPCRNIGDVHVSLDGNLRISPKFADPKLPLAYASNWPGPAC